MTKKLLLRDYQITLLVIDVQERLLAHIFNRQQIIRNLRILIQGLQLLNVPIIVTEQYSKGIGQTVQEIKDVLKEYKPVEKITFGCLDNPEFSHKIGEPNDKKYLLLAGIESHVCVLQTTLGLLEKGFNCGVIVDCIGSREEINYNFALERMGRSGADLLTTEMVLFDLMKSAGHPAFKQILKLIK